MAGIHGVGANIAGCGQGEKQPISAAIFAWDTLNPFAKDTGLADHHALLRKSIRWLFWAGLLAAIVAFPPLAMVLGGPVLLPAIVASATLVVGLLFDTLKHYADLMSRDVPPHLSLFVRGTLLTLTLVAMLWLLFPVAVPAAMVALLAKVGVELVVGSVWLPIIMVSMTALYHAILAVGLYGMLLPFCYNPEGVQDTMPKRVGRAVVAMLFVLLSVAPAAVLLVFAKFAAVAAASWQGVVTGFGGYQSHAVATIATWFATISSALLCVCVSKDSPKPALGQDGGSDGNDNQGFMVSDSGAILGAIAAKPMTPRSVDRRGQLVEEPLICQLVFHWPSHTVRCPDLADMLLDPSGSAALLVNSIERLRDGKYFKSSADYRFIEALCGPDGLKIGHMRRDDANELEATELYHLSKWLESSVGGKANEECDVRYANAGHYYNKIYPRVLKRLQGILDKHHVNAKVACLTSECRCSALEDGDDAQSLAADAASTETPSELIYGGF